MNSRTTDPRDWPKADVPSFVDLLPYHSVDPQGNVALLIDSSDAEPRWMGVAWKLAAPETEAAADGEIGLLASRLDALLATLPCPSGGPA